MRWWEQEGKRKQEGSRRRSKREEIRGRRQHNKEY